MERNLKFHEKSDYANIVGPLIAPNSTLSFTSTPLHSNDSTFNPAVFGSSQLDGCPGDFCQFDLSFIENKDLVSGGTGNGNDYTRNDLSDFRRRLLIGSMSTED